MGDCKLSKGKLALHITQYLLELCEPYLNFCSSAFHVWWRDDLKWWRIGGGEVTYGGKMVGGESSWWQDDRKPFCHREEFKTLMFLTHLVFIFSPVSALLNRETK